MAELKLVIGNKDGKTYQKTVEDFSNIIGKRIGEKISGDILELAGYELEIKGGSDKSGFPMRKGVPRTSKIYAQAGTGINPKKNKNRSDFIRKTVASDTISERTNQINLQVLTEGKKALTELFETKSTEEAPKEEAKPVEKEAPKVEEKNESKN
tara:strand:- start:332 stop:793 length:462 start_codon:yes stop_codon:yes gene_type:complete